MSNNSIAYTYCSNQASVPTIIIAAKNNKVPCIVIIGSLSSLGFWVAFKRFCLIVTTLPSPSKF